MDLIAHFNSTIVVGFDKYYVPDLNLDTAKIVFFLESPHKDEIPSKEPLCGFSGKNFSRELFSNEVAYGLLDKKEKAIGVLETSPYPLQLKAYKEYFGVEGYNITKSNIEKIDGFENLRKMVIEIEHGDKTELINHLSVLPDDILNTNLYKNYCKRVDNIFDQKKIETIVVCGLFAQRFFNSYLTEKQYKLEKPSSLVDKSKKNTSKININQWEISLIYINHPKEWYKEHNNYPFLKNTLQKIKDLISESVN